MEDELEAFRLRWKSELATPRSATGLGDEASVKRDTSPAAARQISSRDSVQSIKAPSETTAGAVTTDQISSSNARDKQSARTESLDNNRVKPEETAVEIYARAVKAEQMGQLNDALRMYRLAFRKDDRVDRSYHRLLQSTSKTGEKLGKKLNSPEDSLVFEFERTLQLEPDYERQKQLKKRSSTEKYIEKLTTSFRQHPWDPIKNEHIDIASSTTAAASASQAITTADVPIFHPRIQGRKVPINILPGELLLQILSHLITPSQFAQYPDIRSLERGFSLVSRKARLFTLQSITLYKTMCLDLYKPPLQLDPSAGSCAALAIKAYSLDYRLMLIEQPRIRTDGVYISQITYLRRGAQDGSSYYDPTHCVTYYRYLVFLPKGEVVSLLSNDLPANVVPFLLSSYRPTVHTTEATPAPHPHPGQKPQQQSGYTVGRWKLRNSSSNGDDNCIVQLSSLEDPRISSPDDIKYSFNMYCKLKSTTRGKNNKLEMITLLAKNHRTDEESPIPITQANGSTPSFYFSRVLSYD